MPKMCQHTDLSITHRKSIDTSGLKATFRRANTTLPNITILHIQSRGSWAFMVGACPNTELLILSDNLYDKYLMQATRDLTKLRNPGHSYEFWSRRDIEKLSTIVPDLEGLTLKGEIGEEYLSVRYIYQEIDLCVKLT